LNINKKTGLHLAAVTGNSSMIKAFVDNGANPKMKDIDGNTPMHYACDIVKEMDINKYNSTSFIAKKKIEIIKELLQSTENTMSLFNSVNNRNQTPLDVAVIIAEKEKTKEILEFLLNNYRKKFNNNTLNNAKKMAKSDGIKQLLMGKKNKPAASTSNGATRNNLSKRGGKK